MTDTIDHSRKVKRAYAIARIGAHPASRRAMLDHVPDSALDALTAAQLAELLDAMWSLAQDSKALADREAIQDGGVWDSKRQMRREFAA